MDEHFIDTELGSIHLLSQGLSIARTPILVLPGILLSTHYWKVIVAQHEYFRDRPVVLVSLPAHHPSSVPVEFSREKVTAVSLGRVMLAILQSLSLPQPILMGHSTGGYMVLNAALATEGKIAGVISIAGFSDGRWSGGEGLLQRLADGNAAAGATYRLLIRLMQISFWIYFLSSALLTRRAVAYLRSSEARKAMRDAHADFKFSSPSVLQEFMAGIYRIRASGTLTSITAPALILSGKYDPVIPSIDSELLKARIQTAQSHSFDTGHMIFFEDRDGFSLVVSDFVEAIERNEGGTAL